MPTDKEIQEFWEWYGFKYIPVNSPDGKGGWYPNPKAGYSWVYPSGYEDFEPPPIDLNNLFKYGLLPLIDSDISSYYRVVAIWHQALLIHYKTFNPAQALYQALNKGRKEKWQSERNSLENNR